MRAHVCRTRLLIAVVACLTASWTGATAAETPPQPTDQPPGYPAAPPAPYGQPEMYGAFPPPPVGPGQWQRPPAWAAPYPGYQPAPERFVRPYPPPRFRGYAPPRPEQSPVAADTQQTVEQDAELAAARKELEDSSTRLQSVQTLLEQARAALTRNDEDRRQQQARQQDLEQRLQTSKAEAEAAQARVAALEAELSAARSGLESSRARIAEQASLQQALDAAVAARDQLQTELNGLTTTLEQQAAAATGKEQALTELKLERDGLQTEMALLSKRLAHEQEERAQNQQKLDELAQQQQTLNQELAAATGRLETLQASLARAEAATAAATSERDGLQAQLTALQEADAEKDSMAVNAIDAERVKLNEQIATMDALLDAEVTAKTAMQKALADATSTRERLLEQVESLNARLETASREDSAQTDRTSDLQAQLSACNERLTATKLTLSNTLAAAAPAATAAKPSAPALPVTPTTTMPTELAALEPTMIDDRDRDGVADNIDLCPDQPDTSKTDLTGCPGGAPIALSGVNFRYDSDVLTSSARNALDRVASMLRDQPDLKFEVAGHSDAQGNADYNLWLSEQRAKAVMAYLIERGLPAERLSARGYGGEQPIADNDTREGLARNRRVELRRLP